MNDWVLRADWPAPPSIVAGTTLRNGGEADLPAPPQWLKQVHGNRAVVLGSPDFEAGVPEADAVIGGRPGDLCVVRTADCLPGLLCSEDGQEIAAVHAGWRGLAAGVIEAAVARFSEPPRGLLAWIGPAISQAAFEVGDEVREQFGGLGVNPADYFVANERGRWQADLVGLARARMRALGITSIFAANVCTYTDAARCFSYRRDGETGRHLSFIYRK
ncbi:MAG: peptidoglycan editing factor PgeF [Proteobacteria bacterium]|nr:peptidoglycan editing factor PgeF [Pseudomonadota bacterium]